jgi:hypothetical protein
MEAKEFGTIFNYNLEKGIKIYAMSSNTTGTVLKICVEATNVLKVSEDKFTNKTIDDAIKKKHQEIYNFFKNREK